MSLFVPSLKYTGISASKVDKDDWPHFPLQSNWLEASQRKKLFL